MATDKQPVQAAPNMSDHEWGDLLYSIEQQKCILVVGPEVYTASGEASMHKWLVAFLEQQATQLRIRLNDNGWVHLQPMGNEYILPIRQFVFTLATSTFKAIFLNIVGKLANMHRQHLSKKRTR